MADGHAPTALLLFYRALLLSGDTAPVDALLRALRRQGLAACGVFLPGLRDPATAALLAELACRVDVPVILNATGFAVGAEAGASLDPLRAFDCPIIQAILSGEARESWAGGSHGLRPRDLAMSLVLPELDGRIAGPAVSFKEAGEREPRSELAPVRHRPLPDRVDRLAELAVAWAALRATSPGERRLAIVLPNYPIRDGRLANGVGLDTPASAALVLLALRRAGYDLPAPPADGQALMAELLAGPTNAGTDGRVVRASLDLATYREGFACLPATLQEAVLARWGRPEADPRCLDGRFPLAILPLGRVVIGLQPARGYDVDPSASHHDPDLPPPHAYLAFHWWLRHAFGAQAIVHLGKHGNLEWLPGKATALSAECWPDAVLGALPQLYPFIVNDPGEGSQAKRRTAAVILDHLTPPLTRAEGHGDSLELERLLDELAAAAALDGRRSRALRREIADRLAGSGLARDLRLDDLPDEPSRLAALDRHLCDLKELQIRDGLHLFGAPTPPEQLPALLVALTRQPRGRGAGGEASLIRALAADLGLAGFDPLSADPAIPWTLGRPTALLAQSEAPWRHAGHTIERLERLALALVAGERPLLPDWSRTGAVLAAIAAHIAPLLARSATDEMGHLLRGLDGRFVPPGASGAPTRGRLDMLPTGRNFYSVDPRAVPTPTAWRLGWQSAGLVLEHYLQAHGEWPRRLALSAWGTANMRTGGEDIAQVLAFLGCRPLWDGAGGRVTGVEVLPLDVLGRPRIDVTLRISGFFRDAFPAQLELLDDAFRAVAALEEPEGMNPLAAAARAQSAALLAAGTSEAAARRLASLRIFGSAPGSYGSGLQTLVDEDAWESEDELARAFLDWGSFAYGRSLAGRPEPAALRARLGATELVLHNQDNREHDLLDSDDYWQFEGGLALAVRHLRGVNPEVLHVDGANPSRVRVRPLETELGLVVRGRATNPRWLAGVMRHGYKGGAEIAATVDYLLAFAATTRLVSHQQIEALFEAYLLDPEVRGFLAAANPDALREIAAAFGSAIRRNLWQPRRNSTSALLDELVRGGQADQ